MFKQNLDALIQCFLLLKFSMLHLEPNMLIKQCYQIGFKGKYQY